MPQTQSDQTMQEEMINRLTFPLQMMHQSRLRALKGLLNYNMSLVFTFLYAINQAKTLTLEGTFDFHKKLAR